MSVRALPARLTLRLRRPKTTVRWRLTLLYSVLFLASGAALLAITYTLVEQANSTVSPNRFAGVQFSKGVPLTLRHPSIKPRHSSFTRVSNGELPPPLRHLLRSNAGRTVIQIVGAQQRIVDLHRLVIESAVALALMALLSTLLGWIVAGRVLAPLRTMTVRTREISEDNLHLRLALDGPPDELHQLADTIDALLARLQGAFDDQRRFAANASHELRTPLTTVRALLEMVLSDRHADLESFRTVSQEVLEETGIQEQLIDALLALARGQRGLERHEPLDLAAVTAEVLTPRELEATAHGLRMHVSLATARLVGDPWLLARLVANLIDNAIHHNIPQGHVDVTVATIARQATITVTNSGPQIPPAELQRLLAPFQRLGAERVSDFPTAGLGLGLSIVDAIAHAHNAELDLRPATGGGLVVKVRFPRVPAPARPQTLPGVGEPLAAKELTGDRTPSPPR